MKKMYIQIWKINTFDLGDEKIVRILIQNGANHNVTNDNGLTPLHFSVLNGK